MKPLSALKCCLGLLLALPTVSLLADTVETVDGSRLVGRILSIDSGKVVLETAYAGKIEIAQAQVARISTDAPINVRLASGTTMAGRVESDGADGIRIVGTDGTLSAKTDRVAASWPVGGVDPQQEALRQELAKKDRKWAYTASVDLNGKRGNSDKLSSQLALSAVLESDNDRLRFYGSYDRSEENKRKTADEIKGGVDYTSYFYRDLGWYGRIELETDEFENLDFRATAALGLTYRFIKTETQSLEGRAGVGYRFESFKDTLVAAPGPGVVTVLDPVTGLPASYYVPGSDVETMTIDFGILHDWRFASWGRAKTSLTYAPSVEDFGDYNLNHDTGIEIPLGLSDFWVLRLGVANDYKSRPAFGRKSLDTTYYTRLVLRWQ